MILTMWAEMATTTHSLKCSAPGRLTTTSKLKLVKWPGSYLLKFTKFLQRNCLYPISEAVKLWAFLKTSNAEISGSLSGTVQDDLAFLIAL